MTLGLLHQAALALAALMLTPAVRAAAEPASILLVAATGYRSCGAALTPAADAMIRRAQTFAGSLVSARGPTVRVIASCFNDGGFSQPETLYVLPAGSSYARSTTIPEYQRLVAQEALVPNTTVYFIGHSHGAWLLLKTLLALDGRARVAGLVTIDAISFVDCTPQRMVQAVVGVNGLNAPLPGCTAAVTDLSSDFQKIADGARWWRNVYEVQEHLLHSGPIFQASENINVAVSLSRPRPGELHAAVRLADEAWEPLEQALQADAAAGP